MQMPFIEDNDVVQQFAATSADPSFGDPVLPGASIGGPHRLCAKAAKGLPNSPREDRVAVVYAESAAMLAFWIGVLALAGPWNFLFLFVLPLIVANSVIMSYIATNHFLNPLTEINDPLANTLSVTSPRWLEKLHLQFGYHVEHHLFPTLSARHAPVVRDVLIRLYGDRYLTMPHVRALRLLYTRPKIHDGHDTLVDPRTMAAFAVLAPGDLSMPSLSSS